MGVVSLLLYLWMWRLSLQFNWGEGYRDRPILTYLFIYLCLFACYGGAVALIWKQGEQPRLFWTMVVLGLLFRAAIMPAQQIQEDDVYRYLWDGKVFAQGINPYKFSPAEVTRFKEFMIRDPRGFEETYDTQSAAELARLYDLKWESPESLVYQERINHPRVATLYPPLAQVVFRLASHIRPNSILTLRLLFLIFDLMTLVFILWTLDAVGRPRIWALVYFWCPLVIKETFNSTHLDIIGIAMLAGALCFVVRRRYLAAGAMLALSVVGKLYPAVLLPLLLKQQWQEENDRIQNPWLRCGLSVLVFGGIVALFYLPFIDIGSQTFSGLKEFATRWQQNDSIFALILGFFRLFVEAKGPVPLALDLPSLLAKITVALMLAAAMLYLLFWRKEGETAGGSAEPDARAALEPMFWIMALVFILSPVQNPWYLCWIVPFLCIFPWRSGILLTGLVGLYYLDFYWDYQDLNAYAPWTPWIEYTPFYMALAWEWMKRKGDTRPANPVW
ncbi:MAG: DUF2029 domain-containing protein [Nitrospinaceae bacterium]|nr:DUF2029 domain-containing protein [Nitrospinaceae bacterium]